MNVDNYGWESSLSMVANEQTRTARPRHGSVPTLLRPVFMNAVEVGYSYAHCDRDKKLNVRGVTIALWHFICRGHQAIALLPYCFKNYAEKSSRYSELMMLYRLNLIEFTPGYGSEKYTEVNRIMVNRAYETGGCLVARSQMQGITDNKAHLIDVVEQRLLMPTFNGDDIMFPIDGPLGRNGPSLEQTLQCEQGTPDWRSCSEHQLLLSDQRHWLEKLALLVPEKVVWTRMVQMIQAGGSEDFDGNEYENEPPMIPSPPLENPFQHRPLPTTSIPSNHSMSPHPSDPYQSSHHNNHYQMDPYPHHPRHLSNPHQYHQHRRQFDSPRHFSGGGGGGGPSHYHMNTHHPNTHYNPNHVIGGGGGGGRGNSTRLIIRYGSSPPKIVGSKTMVSNNTGGIGPIHRHQPPEAPTHIPHRTVKHSAGTDSVESTESTQSGERESPTPSVEMDEDVARELNAKLIEETRRANLKRDKEEAAQKKKDELLAKLSQIFGYSKSIRVMSKFPNIFTFCVLVEKCIHEPDQEGDNGEFADIWASEVVTESEEVIEEVIEDLIDFSDDPVPYVSSGVEVEQEISSNLIDLMF